jgi:hypothetical protein
LFSIQTAMFSTVAVFLEPSRRRITTRRMRFWAALDGVTKIASSAASVALLIAYSKPPEAVAEQRGAPPLVTHSKTGTWVEGE